MTPEQATADQAATDLARIVESAQRLGIKMDEAEAMRWLTAVGASHAGAEIVHDAATGVFGHRVSMLDFSPVDLERFREIGQIVGFEDRPGEVETALALSGSAAQSKIQTHPGDCDYFERVNIYATTREAACSILAELIRDKALATERGDRYQLIEVKFGSAPRDLIRDGSSLRRGSPLSWSAEEVRVGHINATTPDGEPVRIGWDEAAADPGWCKLDWVVADPARGSLANASNMLDATWETPDGTIKPLDGYLDGYFQEIYLEAESVPIFSKLVRNATPDALDEYVTQLEREVAKYLTQDLNYGKAAKRMYNVFRLTGRYLDAAYLRELFDQPAAVLYQVWSLIRTVEDAVDPGSSITIGQAVSQTDQLIISVVESLDGPEESEIVRSLLRLRDLLERADAGDELGAEVDAARARVINVVNNFFRDRLEAVPTIRAYVAGFRAGAASN
ncbi:MAG: hypothetical protein ACRDGV_13215 [Candidatus Limnocylindria bacterium]